MPIDYSIKDRDSYLLRMKSLIVQLYPNWDDENVSAIGNMMFDIFSIMLDKVTYNQDAQAGEAYIKTATQMASIIDLAYGRGVEIPNRTASYGNVVITVSQPSNRPIAINKDNVTVLTQEDEPKRFLLKANGTIPAGDLSVTIEAENSELQDEIKSPNGTVDWFTYLSITPFIEVVSVIDELGFVWTEVVSLIDSSTTDRHFEVTVNGQGSGKLQFGDGIMGVVPESDLTIEYKTGGGEEGNVAVNSISIIDGDIYDADGDTVSATVDNIERFIGGTDVMAIKRARRYVPNTFVTQLRTVSDLDYEYNSESVTGVARAIFITSDDDVGIEENAGHIVIVPDDGGDPTTALQDAVYTMVTVTKPGHPTFKISVMGPTFKIINVSSIVFLEKGITHEDSRSTIETRLESFFAIQNDDGSLNDNINFGSGYKDKYGNTDPNFPYSEIYNQINDSDGIRKLGRTTLNGLQTDILLSYRDFPTLGTITLIDGDSGESF